MSPAVRITRIGPGPDGRCRFSEIEVGLAGGETRRFARGDVFLADDEGTEGHTTRVLDGPVEALWLSIPEGTVWREVGTGGI